MNIDVASGISDLLYTYESVIIPGLGAIVSTYKPATIDHVQGLIHPPSKQLSFNEHMVTNDGVLYLQLMTVYHITEDQAKKAVRNFVQEVMEKLREREIVVLPKVGRLYQDYEHNMQFLQDSTNFNREVYGLPTVHFYPILKAKENSESKTLAITSSISRPTTRRKGRFNKVLATALPITFVLIIGSVGYFYIHQQRTSNGLIEEIQRIPAELRLNEKPESEVTPFIDDIYIDASIVEKESPKKKQTVERNVDRLLEKENGNMLDAPTDRREETLGPNQKMCVIIIGQFKNKNGVDRRIKEIYKIGFEPYHSINPNNGLHMVGVQFVYEQEKDINTTLKYLRLRFETSAWILKPKK